MFFSVKKLISYFLLLSSWAWTQPQKTFQNNTIRDDYNHYLTLFKKKETQSSFHIFQQNYHQVMIYNQHHGGGYYLTQESDLQPNHIYFTPTIYIYKLPSREENNQKILLCA